jgi:hypothetical protein
MAHILQLFADLQVHHPAAITLSGEIRSVMWDTENPV